MSEVSIAQLEELKVANKTLIERREMAMRLAKNADFRKLILDGWCLHDAASYASSSANPALKPEERADALAMAQAPGHLKRFLSYIVQEGQSAESQAQQIDEMLVEARSEPSVA